MSGVFAKRGILALAAVAAIALASSVTRAAGPVVAGFNTNVFLANDDGSYPANGLGNGTPSGTPVAQSLGFSANYFGTTYTDVYVNNNGNVTFGNFLSTFTPFNITGNTGTPIIAPFFGDVDTRVGNLVTFGTGTINQAQVGGGTHNAFGVNWPNVGYYDEHTDKLNDFQVLLIDRSDTGAGNFDIEFNYGQIQWETGDASGGVGGLGGTSAYVGYGNGTGASGTFALLDGSGVNGALLDGGVNALISHTNDGVLGQYLFTVRSGVVTAPPVTSGVPLPAAAWSGMILLGALGSFKLIRSRKPA